MNIAGRLNKLESTMSTGDEIKINVTRHHSHDEWSASKKVFDAKKALGLLTLQQIRRTIFVGRDMDEDEQPMSKEKARTILKNQGVTA